jgi:transcriptional regulator with XRE-family HTH domain
MEAFGSRLRALMTDRGLTGNALARAGEMSHSGARPEPYDTGVRRLRRSCETR